MVCGKRLDKPVLRLQSQFVKSFVLIAMLSIGMASVLAEDTKIETSEQTSNMRLKVKLFTGWVEIKSTNTAATFHRNQSENLLQFSWAEYRGKQPLRKVSTDELKQTATKFGQKNGFGEFVESDGGSCTFGNFGTAVFRSATHPRIQVWFVTDGTDYILATYICSKEPDQVEVQETKDIVSMATLGSENPK
jgi:hypothetical protein